MQIPKSCLPAGVSMTGTTVLTGKPISLRGHPRASFQMNWSGTPTGVFTFQVCNIKEAIDTTTGLGLTTVTWTTLANPAAFTAQQPAGAFPTEPTGAAGGKGYFAFTDLAAEWIRPLYTNTSSTGTWTNADGIVAG